MLIVGPRQLPAFRRASSRWNSSFVSEHVPNERPSLMAIKHGRSVDIRYRRKSRNLWCGTLGSARPRRRHLCSRCRHPSRSGVLGLAVPWAYPDPLVQFACWAASFGAHVRRSPVIKAAPCFGPALGTIEAGQFDDGLAAFLDAVQASGSHPHRGLCEEQRLSGFSLQVCSSSVPLVVVGHATSKL